MYGGDAVECKDEDGDGVEYKDDCDRLGIGQPTVLRKCILRNFLCGGVLFERACYACHEEAFHVCHDRVRSVS